MLPAPPRPPPRLGTIALLLKRDVPTLCCFGGGGGAGGASQALKTNANHLPTRAGFMAVRARPQKDPLGPGNARPHGLLVILKAFLILRFEVD